MNDYKLSNGSSVILDLIRGVSAQIVVVGHCLSYFGIFTFLHEPNFPWMQNVAVLIFFLLSGYLITYSASRKFSRSDYNFKHFFADRFSRIYTAFIPALIFVLLIDAINIKCGPDSYSFYESFDIRTFVGNLFMLQDFPSPGPLKAWAFESFGSARPFWTLAIEWWIYLWFGFIVFAIVKMKKISPISLVILSFLSIVPFYNLIMGRGNGLTAYWLFGASIYLLDRQKILSHLSKRIKAVILIAIILLGFLRAYLVMEAYDPIFAFLLAIAMWLCIDLFRDFNFKGKVEKVIRYNASYSYTLYLVHYSIIDFSFHHIYEQYIFNPYLMLLICFLIANLISILIGRYTEIKLTKGVKMRMYDYIGRKSVSQ